MYDVRRYPYLSAWGRQRRMGIDALYYMHIGKELKIGAAEMQGRSQNGASMFVI